MYIVNYLFLLLLLLLLDFILLLLLLNVDVVEGCLLLLLVVVLIFIIKYVHITHRQTSRVYAHVSYILLKISFFKELKFKKKKTTLSF